MFAYSPVDTENIFYNPKNDSSNKQPSPSCNFLSMISETSQHKRRFEQHREASLKRNQFKQELERRHQLCAENERQRRERTQKQTALKKTEECNALRKFYEIKSAQFRKNSSSSTSSSQSSLTSTLSSITSSSITSSSFSSSSSSSLTSSKPSKSTISLSIKKFQAAYKIHSFIKHYIEKKNTLKIISNLIKLRSIQNRLAVLKSINFKRNLTFDSINKNNNQVLPISPNNKAFLIYKDSILKILNQLNDEFSDKFYLVRERKQFIENTVYNILKHIDNFRDLQHKKFIENIENEDFVII